MLYCRLLTWVICALFAACASSPSSSSKLDESRPLGLCSADSKKVDGTWYVLIERHPNASPHPLSSGDFGARVTVWVTFENGQQLVTVRVAGESDRARVDSGEVSAGRMITGQRIVDVDKPIKCQAFELLK
jgi:hypothetical protein